MLTETIYRIAERAYSEGNTFTPTELREVEDRLEETSQVPIPDLAAGSDHSGNPTPGESFVVRMVEDAWYDVTKGEINPDEDMALRDLILSLYRSAREYADSSAAFQVNRFGREYPADERVETEEVAFRVARALAILWFGDA